MMFVPLFRFSSEDVVPRESARFLEVAAATNSCSISSRISIGGNLFSVTATERLDMVRQQVMERKMEVRTWQCQLQLGTRDNNSDHHAVTGLIRFHHFHVSWYSFSAFVPIAQSHRIAEGPKNRECQRRK